MKEVQINTRVPADVWAAVNKLVANRVINDEPLTSKKEIITEALREYCRKEMTK